MARYTTVYSSYECTDLQDFNRSVTLPIKEDCEPTQKDWILNDCDRVWCESKKSYDPAFTMVYEAGDKIQFQFRFVDEYNDDPTNPVDGWGAFIKATLNCSVGDDFTTLSDFATGMVGWDGNYSYQILEVDTALFARCKCWSLTVTSYKKAEGLDVVSQEICTEQFGASKCDSVVKVQGVYTNYDCFGNWYGQPYPGYVGTKLIYNNTLKFDGFLRDSGYSIKKELFIDRAKSVTTRKIWTLTFRNPVPAYVKNTRYGQLLAGEKLLIDDKEYLLESVQAEPFLNMFKVQVEVWQECEMNKTC